MCVSVDAEGIVKDAKALEEIPGLLREAITKGSGQDPMQELQTEAGLDFNKDVLPALPRQFAVAVSTPGEGEKVPHVVFVGRPHDEGKANEVLVKIRKKVEEKGFKASEEKYKGSTIVRLLGESAAKESGGNSQGKSSESAKTGMSLNYAFCDRHLLLGNSVEALKEALDAHESADKGLEGNATYQALRKQVREEADVLVYMDLFKWLQVTGAMQGLSAGVIPTAAAPPSAEGMMGGKAPFPSGMLQQFTPEQLAFFKGTCSITAVDFTGQGVETDSLSQLGEGMKKAVGDMAAVPPVDRALLARMPAGPMALVAETSPAQLWGSVRKVYAEFPQTAMVLNMVQGGLSRMGLDLDRDVIGWMTGTATAGLYYNVKPFPDLAIAWGIENQQEVKGALDKIGGVVSQVSGGKVRFTEEQKEGATEIKVESAALAKMPFFSPAFALTDKVLYFSSLESGLKGLLSQGQGSAADSVSELPKEGQFLGMVDFPAFSEFLLDLGPALGPFLRTRMGQAVENRLKKAAELLNCLGKATGYSQVRADGTSVERYVLPVGYDAMVKVLKGWVEAIPARAAGGQKAKGVLQ